MSKSKEEIEIRERFWKEFLATLGHKSKYNWMLLRSNYGFIIGIEKV